MGLAVYEAPSGTPRDAPSVLEFRSPAAPDCSGRIEWCAPGPLVRLTLETSANSDEEWLAAADHEADRVAAALSLTFGAVIDFVRITPPPPQPTHVYYDLADRIVAADYESRRIAPLISALESPAFHLPFGQALRRAAATDDRVARFVLLWGITGFLVEDDSPTAVDAFLASQGIARDHPDRAGRLNRETRFGAFRNEIAHMVGRRADFASLHKRARPLCYELADFLWEYLFMGSFRLQPPSNKGIERTATR